jgi:hypothetical protein
VAGTAPVLGQVLKWNGSQWAPDTDAGTTYTGGIGIDITGTVISNLGDPNPADDITNTTLGQGDVTGLFPSLTVTRIQGNPISVGTPSNGQILKWDGLQWSPALDDNTTYTAGTGLGLVGNVFTNTGDTNAADDITIGSGAAGDLSGVYPNPTVDGLQGNPVSANAPGNGQVLKWNGTEWAPGSDDGTTYTAGAGIDVTGTVITNLGDTNAADDITIGSGAAGDLSGVYPNPTVDGLQGNPVSANAPGNGQVLKWNGTEWAPGSDDGTTYTAGAGIDVTGTVITNLGDTNAADDITTSTLGAGDVNGFFPNLTVDGLQGNPVSASAPGSGQVLKWNGTEWAPGSDDGTTYTAGAGIDVTGTVITNLGDTNAADDITNTTLGAGDVSGFFPNLTVTSIQGNAISAFAPVNGQILKWNGSQWDLASDDNNTYTAGTGLSLSGNVFTNTGDTDASDDITNTTSAGGDLDGTYPNPTVDGLQGNPVAATAPSNGQVLKWNGTEWAPGADGGNTYTGGTGIDVTGTVITNLGDTDAADDITNTTAAAGDLNGTYPNPTVDGLQGNPVSSNAPLNGEVLKWNGSVWIPGTDDNTTYTAGTGLSLVGTVFTNTGDTNAADDITNTSAAGGDASGTFSGLTVTGIQGNPVSSVAPSSVGQILKWDGFQWTVGTDNGTNYVAGSGIGITGTVISNLGDTDASDDITNTTTAGGDLSGTYPNPTVDALQGSPLSATAPTSVGQVLKWDGSQWAPGADDGTTYTAGAGIDVTGTVITNTGDTDGSDDITITSVAGGDVNGTFSNLTVTDLQNVPVSSSAPTTIGQVLKWNGTSWAPGSDDGANYTGGTGITISGTVITNSGDTDPSNDITNTTVAGGDLNGLYPNPTVDALQGNPVSSSIPTSGQVLKWDGLQWAPSLDNNDTYTAGTGISVVGNIISNIGDTNAADDITNTTVAGGDLSGTYPNPTVDALQGNPVANSAPTSGQVLKWNGSQWAPSADNNDTYTAGSGISIVGNVIANLGDPNAADDITNTTIAGGDLSGTYPNPTVDALQGNPVSLTAPTIIGQVLEWDGTQWGPGTDNVDDLDADPTNEIQTLSVSGSTLTLSNGGGSVPFPPTYTAGAGIALSGTTILNIGDTDASDDITNSTTANGDLAGTYPNPTVDGLQGNPVSASAPTVVGQVLEWDGTQWAPGTDDGILYGAGTGIDITGNVITNTGDTSNTNEIQTLSITGTTISLSNGGSSIALPYTAGAGIDISGVFISNTGDTDASDDITNTTLADGDLDGTYPNPTVDGLQGNPVSATAPTTTGQMLRWDGTTWTPGVVDFLQGNPVSATNPTVSGQVLQWDGASWTPGTDSFNVYTAGSGIDITGNVIANIGDTDSTNDITNTTTAAGDLSGTYPNPTVAALQGTAVSATAPTVAGQVLKYDGTEWVPGTDSINVYTAGTGIDITGNVVSNIGDTDSTNDITNTTAAGGDLNGTYPNPTVAALQGTAVSATAPTVAGQVLKYDGTEWVPGTDNVNVYTAGTGIDITGNVVSNIGDTDSTNDITNTTAAGGDLSGTYPDPTVAAIQGNAVSSATPQTAEYFRYDGTSWIPDSILSNDLQINGDLLPADNTYNLGGATNRWVEVFAFNGVINTSDMREKEDITELNYGLDEIMKLRPVSYSWIKRPELGTKIGLIAQEVQPVINEVVKTKQLVRNEITGELESVEMDRFGINYTDLIPVIIKGMQEQQEIVEKQNKLIEVQQSAIDVLEARIQQLEEKLK